MSKLSRSALKGIVKECLVEILQEGIEINNLSLSEAKQRKPLSNKRPSSKNTPPSRSEVLDRISYGRSKGSDNKNSNFESNVRRITDNMTQDPVLSSILSDTARTTLQEQRSAEASGPNGMFVPSSAAGDKAARMASMSDPMEVFSDSADRWASLAFSEDLPKG